MVLKNYVCMCASMCLLKYLVVSLEGKSQELPTISAPIQPVTAPITITICQFQFQFQIQISKRERDLGERGSRGRRRFARRVDGHAILLLLFGFPSPSATAHLSLYIVHYTNCMKIEYLILKLLKNWKENIFHNYKKAVSQCQSSRQSTSCINTK